MWGGRFYEAFIVLVDWTQTTPAYTSAGTFIVEANPEC